MSNEWYTILGPEDWDGVNINTGNKKVDGKYFNILGDKNVQLSASGIMWLVGGSGIRLISTGPVDASGFRAHDAHAIRYHKIDYSGNIVPIYPGPTGAVLYKADDENAAGIPGDLLVYNTGINKLTMPSQPFGALGIPSGDVKALSVFTPVQFIPQTVVGSGESATTIPAKVEIDGNAIFKQDVQIYPNLAGYKDSILTHMGKDEPAKWVPAPYLKADGVLWNRYPKRPVKFDEDKNTMIFYLSKPDWAQDWVDAPTVEKLDIEMGDGKDTIEILRDDDRLSGYVKFASQIRYIVDDTNPDITTPITFLYEEVQFKDPYDPLGEEAPLQDGLAVKLCPPEPINATWAGGNNTGSPIGSGNGYAWSVNRGGYLDMQLGKDAKYRFNCVDPDDPATIPANPEQSPVFKFKPSTMNTISIRPNVNTSFNKLAENIDFIIYGERKTQFNNYEESLFDLDDSSTPTGLIPAFRVHANIPNAVSGNISSGVIFSKYIDRSRVTPTGWDFDYNAKISINTNDPYIIDTIPSGTGVVNNVTATGYISYYADVTIGSVLYSNNIITEGLYLRPKPLENNQGEYIANALLTLDRSGKIISRIPKTNATAPGKPLNVRLDPGHQNGIGNGEASIVWSAPVSDGGEKVIAYLIQFSINNGESWTDIPNNLYGVNSASPTTLSATITGLSQLVQYRFRVAAQNKVGVGNYSDSSNTIVVGSSVPKAPPNFVASRAFDETEFSNIQLTWDQPQAGSDGVILGYTIEESIDNGNTWYWYNEPSALITEVGELITGSVSAIDYYYRISAWNNNGQGAYAYLKSASNLIIEIDPEEEKKEEDKRNDVLSNWDFGSVLFTGVCQL
jgi:hypothetical protein